MHHGHGQMLSAPGGDGGTEHGQQQKAVDQQFLIRGEREVGAIADNDIHKAQGRHGQKKNGADDLFEVAQHKTYHHRNPDSKSPWPC